MAAPRHPTSHSDILTDLRSGAQTSLDKVVVVTYHELRAIAHHRLGVRDQGGTLSTTALVNEAYLRLVDQSRAGWRDRAHFLASASLAMRHVLVDKARERFALKRGGVQRQVTLDDQMIAVEEQAGALLQLDDALKRLASWNPRLAQVVDCRFFGGLTEQETANALDLTTRTVQRDWVKHECSSAASSSPDVGCFARAWPLLNRGTGRSSNPFSTLSSTPRPRRERLSSPH